MSELSLDFKRIVVGIGGNVPDPPALHFAAELAKLLRLSLFGLFAHDPRITSAVGFQFVREFRTLEQQWRPLEGRSLLDDLEMRVAIARRAFDDAAQALGVAHDFEILSATPAEALGVVSGAADIVLVSEPRTPADRALGSYSGLIDTAMQTGASILVLPRQVARRRGPVLAIAGEADNSTVERATAIASALNERVEVIEPEQIDSFELESGRLRERMIVMTKGTSSALSPSSIAAERYVPVLILGSV